jgi:hypothetical protein
MKKFNLIILFAVLCVFGLSSCLKSNTEEENDNEIITTMEVHLTPAGGNEIIYKFDDPDGPGGNAATQDVITLLPSKTYAVRVVLLDKTKNPVDVITDEVREEAVDHRFYYEPSSGSNITVSNLDNDANGVPVGITSTWATGAAAGGTLKITLRHYENGGKMAGDLVNSTNSSTDAEVNFTTRIQ